MRIEYDIKLGFKNVMIRPKRSTLKSRSQVNLSRGFNFLHSKYKWEGVPIMAANMDTVGTFEMAKALYKHNIFTTIHKHYSVDEWTSFLKNEPEAVVNYLAVSTGTSEQDANKLEKIFKTCPQLKFICIDVANGYSEHFVAFVKKTRHSYPDKVIMAGKLQIFQ